MLTTLPAYGVCVVANSCRPQRRTPRAGLYKHTTELLGGTFATLNTSAANSFLPTVAELGKRLGQWADAGGGGGGLFPISCVA